MKIIFKKIRLKNFLSVGNNFEEIHLNKNDFTAIMGINGSGKSSLICAITYALYNKPFRKINLSQLINTHNKKNLVVEIEFDIGNNSYRVIRGQKPKIFEIYKNGEQIDEDPSSRDYQEYLENDILKVDFKTFKQINILGKATYIPFMNLTPQHRREIVEDLLDTQIYGVMQGLAKEKVKELKLSISESTSGIAVLNNSIKDAEKFLASFEEIKKEKIDSINFNINVSKEELKRYHIAINELSKKVADAETNIKDRKHSPETIKNALDKLNTEKYSLNSTISNLVGINKRIDGITICTTCLQEVDDNHKKSVHSANEKVIEENNSILPDIIRKIKKADDMIKSMEMEDLNIKISKRDLNYNKEKYDSIKRSLMGLVDEVKKEKEREMTGVADIKGLEMSLNNVTSKYDRDNKSLLLYKEAVDILGDSGIKATLIEKYIPIINESINNLLEGMGLFAQFELDNQFNEVIKSHYRDSFSYHSFSEGQKLRIDLAILLTWRHIAKIRNSVSTNLLIMDEILDGSMDSDGVADFLEILKNVTDSQNVFVISHKESTIDSFDNVIMAEMSGNFTTYREV